MIMGNHNTDSVYIILNCSIFIMVVIMVAE